jgi:hypothetical protein
MKLSSQTTNQSPWHRERANKLHRICSSIAGRHARGERLRRLFSWFAWYYKGHNYRGDPSRPLNFSKQTFERAFSLWRKGGQVAAALLPQYKPRRSAITAPVLIRFIEVSGRQQLPSMKSAWEKFAKRGGNSGCGRRSNKPVKFSYGIARYYFPAAKFSRLQEQLETIDHAQKTLARLRLGFQAEIITRLPERAPRRRVKQDLEFDI